jgi:hypothetical protein
VVVGLLAAAASGLLYLLSFGFSGTPLTSLAILLLGRGLLGGAESFVITASVSWGLALVDSRNTGKVIAWVGSAMFAAFAIGAPAGAAIYGTYGFAAIAFGTAAAPLITLLLVAPLPTVASVHRARFSFAKVVDAVWVPGLGSALGGVGFGAVTTFVVLLFAHRGWANGWLAYTAYAVAFILARIFFSHVADAIGGAKVALVCALIEALGQALIWLPRFRCRSSWPRAGTKPRLGYGSLHRLSRSGPGTCEPRARLDRDRSEPERPLSRQRHHRALRRIGRVVADGASGHR